MKVHHVVLYALALTCSAFSPLAWGQTQPSIKIISPPTGVSLRGGGNLPLAALVTDPDGTIKQVTYSFALTANETTTYPTSLTATEAPYLIDTTVPPAYYGEFVVTATATDSVGANFSDTVIITIDSIFTLHDLVVAALDEFGSETLTAPYGDIHLAAGSTVTLTAARPLAADAFLNDVNLYLNGEVIASFDSEGKIKTSVHGTSPVRQSASSSVPDVPFSATFTLPGNKALLTGLSGAFVKNLGALTKGFLFDTVTSDHPAPQIKISNITSGTKVNVRSSNQIEITATPQATAEPVQSVEYFVNGTAVNGTTNVPYRFDFQPTSAGKYIVCARATDISNLSVVSDPVLIEAVEAGEPIINLEVAGDGTAVEGGKKGKIFVERSGDLSEAVTVLYKVKGTAVPNVDYKELPGEILLAAGVNKATIKIKPLSANTVPGTRKVKLKLLPSSDGSYGFGTDTVAKVKVIDGD